MIDFEKHTMLVYSVFNNYFSGFRDWEDDLIQEGLIGLWKACKTFDNDRGIKFSTYAVKCIRNEMGMFTRKLKKHNKTISLDKVKEGTSEVPYLEAMVEERNCIEGQEYILEALIEAAKEAGYEELLRMKLEGMKQVDIAKKLGIHQATVSERMRYLYNKVRKSLDLPEK